MRKLGELPSYDVYSLRIALRQQGIDVNDVESLKLSEGKARELKDYMTTFTRPLIMEIYGDSDSDMKQGIEKFRAIEKSAPALPDLD